MKDLWRHVPIQTICQTTFPGLELNICVSEEILTTEASMDPRNVEIKSPRPSYFILTCLGIPRHDDKKYVNMST